MRPLAQSAPVGRGAALRFSELIGALPHRRGAQCPLCCTRAVPPVYIILPSSRLSLPPSPAPRRPLVPVSSWGLFWLWAGSLGRPLQALVLERALRSARTASWGSKSGPFPSLLAAACGGRSLGRSSITLVVTRGPLVLLAWNCLQHHPRGDARVLGGWSRCLQHHPRGDARALLAGALSAASSLW